LERNLAIKDLKTGLKASNKKEDVINAIRHRETRKIPYQLDLTHDVLKRLTAEIPSIDFEKGIGSCLALERNESFQAVGEDKERDMFGVVWRKDQTGDFGVVDTIILTEPTLKGYTFPEPDEALIREKCERLTSVENLGLFKMYIIGFSLFERAWSLRGMENVLTDFILDPTFANELLENITQYNLKVMDIVMEYPVDGIFFGDDWGQQKGLIMGPALWRKFIKPYLLKMYSHAKKKGLYVCQHSCGDVEEVFSDLIDIGLDIYNTFQPEIYDISKVKKEYGKHLTFYGGISTQHILPHGTAEQVKEVTKKTMEIMHENGGFIVAPTHAIPTDVPTENILAFIEAVQNQ